MKDLFDISWKVDEPTYREDSALSYSTLSRFEKNGFNSLPTLFDKIESPSLTFGSAVDALITGGQEEFDSKFIVVQFPPISDTLESIVKDIFTEFHITHPDLNDVPDIEIIGRAANYNYQNNWKPETRAKVIKEKCSEYYRMLYLAGDRTILSDDIYQQVDACVRTLRSAEATKWFFEDNSVFDDSVKRYYQLKFKTNFGGNIYYRCMMDLVVVDYKQKKIYPVDLKTSSHKEWDFPKSFIQWNYQIQARLYYRILKDILSRDDYFKDFEVEPYRFIVINKETLTPLVWKFPQTKEYGDIVYTTNKDEKIILKEPFDLGAELNKYLLETPIVPLEINEVGDNDLESGILRL